MSNHRTKQIIRFPIVQELRQVLGGQVPAFAVQAILMIFGLILISPLKALAQPDAFWLNTSGGISSVGSNWSTGSVANSTQTANFSV